MSLHWAEDRYIGILNSWDFIHWQADMIWIFMVLILRGITHNFMFEFDFYVETFNMF